MYYTKLKENENFQISLHSKYYKEGATVITQFLTYFNYYYYFIYWKKIKKNDDGKIIIIMMEKQVK